MKQWFLKIGLIGLGLFFGYGIGAYQWRGMAVIESYAIGYDHGYLSGASDASIPGVEVVEVSPDGKIVGRRRSADESSK